MTLAPDCWPPAAATPVGLLHSTNPQHDADPSAQSRASEERTDVKRRRRVETRSQGAPTAVAANVEALEVDVHDVRVRPSGRLPPSDPTNHRRTES